MINVGKLIQSEIARARHDAEVQMTQNLNQIAQAMSEEFRKVQYELSEVRSNTVTECKSKGDQTDDATEDGHMPELGASDTELELLDGFRRVDHDADSVGSDSGPNAEMLDRLIIDLVPCNLRVEPVIHSELKEEEVDIGEERQDPREGRQEVVQEAAQRQSEEATQPRSEVGQHGFGFQRRGFPRPGGGHDQADPGHRRG